MNGKPNVSETTDQDFAQDVFERSKEHPVVVDFWAPWCQPCLMLAPKLEAMAAEYDGKFQLVKVNVDEHQQAASEFNVSGIPAVFAVVDGKPVDGFGGLLSDEQLREWMDRILDHAAAAKAEQLEATDPAAAHAVYTELLVKNPEDAAAIAGLGRSAHALGDLNQATSCLQKLEQLGPLDEFGERLRAMLAFQDTEDEELTQLEQTANASPEDWPLQVEYADALGGAHQHQKAMDIYLKVIEFGPANEVKQAKAKILDLFRINEGTPLVHEYRQKLTTLLY